MKKKLVGVLLTAAMAVSALAGCGSKQAAAPAESKDAEEKTEKESIYRTNKGNL